MSEIRKKSLKATAWIYAGFLVGAVNTWFFAHKAWFSPDQYGLTTVLRDVGQLFFALSVFGGTTFLFKFFPYYEDNLEKKQNDLLGIALLVGIGGFILTAGGAYIFKPLIVQKFSANSPMLVEYFYWTLPIAFSMLLYQLLEAYSYGFHKGVLTNMLRETVLRLYTFILIILKVLNLINFQTFIGLFAFQYAFIVVILGWHLHQSGQLWITFRISKVTRKFKKKIIAIMAFTFIVIIVTALRQTIDGLVLAAKKDLGNAGIFGFSVYITSILIAPFRSMSAVTIPLLSRAWKEKKMAEISRIYKRSSINLLCFALLAFFCIWLNFEQAIVFFNISHDYLQGKWVFFLLGIVTIIEMGTGVNGQIIGTSIYWRLELWTSLLLTALIIPLSYFLTVRYGITGPAFANLVSFSIYNFVRYWFLYKKFGLQPFSIKTAEVLLISILVYLPLYFLFDQWQGLAGLIIRTSLYVLLFGLAVYLRDITPDLKPVVGTVMKRLRKKSSKL